MKYHIKQPPKCGTTRIRRRFLFIPKCIGNELRWLEVAQWEEKYRAAYCLPPDVYVPAGWTEIRWT